MAILWQFWLNSISNYNTEEKNRGLIAINDKDNKLMTEQWIQHPIMLTGETVVLLPLATEHFEKLYVAASDKKLWELVPVNCSKRETFDTTYHFALAEREKGNQYPFVIFHKETNDIIGSTRFFEIFPTDKKLEIGWTWIVEKYWGTAVNFECKLLLLTYCFEVLQTRRVQIKTDQNNTRSRKAIEKLGAQFEGILRKDRIKENGDSKSAAYYSILDDEWEMAKQKIVVQLAKRKNGREEDSPTAKT